MNIQQEQTTQDLVQERKKLQDRLNFLGLRSTGSEKLERRIAEIDRVIACAK